MLASGTHLRAITCGAQESGAGYSGHSLPAVNELAADSDRVDDDVLATRLPGRDQGHPRAEML